MTTTHSFPTAPAAQRDAGFTLVEVLISIVLMGTVIAAIVGGLLTLIRATETSQEQAEVEAVLIGAADNVSAAEWTPCPLGYQQAVTNAMDNVGWTEGSATIILVEYWDRFDGPSLANGDWTEEIPAPDLEPGRDGCQLSTARSLPPTTLQKMTIRVTSPSGNISRQIEVVKSIITDASGVTSVTTVP